MLADQVLVVICLLFGISMLTMLSEKLRISYPILLVISGLLISLIPAMPEVVLHPDLVFLIFLPPLLYEAAWNTAWKDFWKWKRPIALLSFGLVFFTSAAVALVSNALIPDFTLALGFLLGGIISPPDAVATTTVLQGIRVPKRMITILEGESLVNDASSLIVFRFALAAIVTGQFTFVHAAQQFILVAGMGIGVGLLIAYIIYLIHRFFPTTASIDAALTLVTPYTMYITAEHFHVSGVLAVVSGGLFLTHRSQKIFSSESRIQAAGLWDTLAYLLNGFVFILIGLQLPRIIHGLGNYSVGQAIGYAVVISLVTIIVRLVWVYPSAYIPRWLFKSIREKEEDPGWKSVFLVGWSGMRGVVSLASALAIPLTLAGERFPHRNLILFITFVVILFTLVIQGLSLRPLVRLLKIEVPEKENEKLQALEIRLRLAQSVLAYIDTNYPEETQQNDTYKRVRDRYERMIEISRRRIETGSVEMEAGSFLTQYRQMLLELVYIRRRELNYMRHKAEYPEELIRDREWELDLEEARLKQ